MRFAVLFFLCCLETHAISAETDALGTPDPKTPLNAAEKLVARMTDPRAPFDDRCAAEDDLAKLRPQEVLPKLLPQLAKGMPEGGIWNGATREIDRKAPIPWQIFYATSRAWSHQVEKLPVHSGGKLLTALLQAAANDKEKHHLLKALTSRWEPDAESPLAKLLVAANEPREIGQDAALALIVHGKQDYRDVMLRLAANADHDEKVQWYNLLADPRHKKRTGVDPRIISLGFRLIQADRARSPEYLQGAYFLANTTGSYIGQDFAPDSKDSRYQSKGGLSEQYFADTVKNALRWWDENHKRVEK